MTAWRSNLPDWQTLPPDALAIIRRSLAAAVLDAESKVVKIQASMDGSGDQAYQASLVIVRLVAQTDLAGRAVLLMSTYPDEEMELVETVEGVILRAQLLLTD